MTSKNQQPTNLLGALQGWWKNQRASQGVVASCGTLLREAWDFVRESTPESRRRRYGDVEYDWDNRVDTTSATVTWRSRLLGVLHSPYQPTEPALFREMLEQLPIESGGFTFIDLGSGKGRALLMASEYPFARIVGVELLPELHHIASDNLRRYSSPTQRCVAIENICADAREFHFPAEPSVLYLFNPLPETGLREVMTKLEDSLRQHPRKVFVLYHNPLLEHVVGQSPMLQKTSGTHQYSVFSSR